MTMSKSLNLKVGYLCNNNCLFCAQSDNKKLRNPKIDNLKGEILKASTYCDKIIFTGGEPTIRKDLLSLIEYAKSLGFKRLQLQSNIRKLHSYEYCRELIAAGINEFAPSLHGHNSKSHDLLTGRKESFDQTIKGLSNLHLLDQYVITNTVITSFNYRHLQSIADLLISHNVAQIQFAYIHNVGNGKVNMDTLTPKIADILPYVFSAIRTVITNNVKCMIESIPICLMKEFSKYCSEYFMPKIEVRDTHYVDVDFEYTRKYKLKIKTLKCESCILYNTCEGAWIEYIQKFGDGEISPIYE